MKFSIIVPVYNVKKYIDKCLNSILNQTYKNFEVIIVNDGSKEDEVKIINKYLKDNRFRYYEKENGGLSDARNFGLKYITGDYLLFVDSDDYIEKELLETLNKELINEKVDLIKFQINIVNEYGDLIRKVYNNSFDNLNKKKAIRKILSDEFIEPAWLYAYRIKFWKKNNFSYPYGMIHEDYALTPIILSCANTFKSINYFGYNYVQRKNSIMSQTSYDKIKKRVSDFKKHYINHKKILNPNDISDKDILGYSSYALICKVRELKVEDSIDFLSFIKRENLVRQITPISIKRWLIKIYLYFFLDKYVLNLNKEYYNEKN